MNIKSIIRRFEDFEHNNGRIEDRDTLAAINFLSEMLQEAFKQIDNLLDIDRKKEEPDDEIPF